MSPNHHSRKKFSPYASGNTGRRSPSSLQRQLRLLIEDLSKDGPKLLDQQRRLSAEGLRHVHLKATAKLDQLKVRTDQMQNVPQHDYHDLELQRMLYTVTCAWSNPKRVGWNVSMYSQRPEKQQDDRYYEAVSIGNLVAPATVVDQHGKIIVWHLPEVLCRARQLSNASAVKDFAREGKLKGASGSWRDSGFDEEVDHGRADFVPAWFQQSRERLSDKLYVSTDIRTAAAKKFISNLVGTEKLMNAITAIIAPKMFKAGEQAFIELAKRQNLMAEKQPTVDLWTSCYSGIELIVNRKTPPHKDKASHLEAFDLLLTGGTYQVSTLKLLELDANLSYNPGTVVALAGRTFTHEVPSWDKGERFCLAHFMREAVHERLGVQAPVFPLQVEVLEQKRN